MKKKPIAGIRDKEEYFIKRLTCPTCGRFLASYSFGRAWTDNGVHEEDARDCRGCGQAIDWSDEPIRPNLLRRE